MTPLFWKFKGFVDDKPLFINVNSILVFMQVRNKLELQVGPIVYNVYDDEEFRTNFAIKSSTIETTKIN